MRRLVAIALALAACGGKKDAGQEKPSGSAVAVAPDAAAAPVQTPDAAAPALDPATHRLFQCVTGSGDKKLLAAFQRKYGYADDAGVENAAYKAFVVAHGDWVRANLSDLAPLADARKARACAEAGLK
jgi:hypothetical protein